VAAISVGPAFGKGRGVFAREHIAAGKLIEEGPVVVVPRAQLSRLHCTVLAEYVFRWGPDEAEAALFLGTCSLCNHSFDPNAVFVLHPGRSTIAFVARRDIAPGEEITTNYHGDPDSQAPVWFAVVP
jgi:SET domain-containing protein